MSFSTEAYKQNGPLQPAHYETRVDLGGSFTAAWGGEAHIIQARPINAPEELQDRPPVYFHAGYSIKNAIYLQHIAERHGRKAFTVLYDQPRPRDDRYWIDGQNTTDKRGELVDLAEAKRCALDRSRLVVAAGQIALAQDILEAGKWLRADRIEAIGQSMASMRLILAADQAPEVISNMVLAYRADTIINDVGAAVRGGRQYIRAWRKQRHAWDSTDNFIGAQAKLPTPVTAYELAQPRDMKVSGENILHSNIRPLLSALRKRPQAPGVGQIAGAHDYIVPPEHGIDNLQSSHDLDYFCVVPGQHAIGDRRMPLTVAMHLLGLVGERRRTNKFRSHQSFSQRLLAGPDFSSERLQNLKQRMDSLPSS